MGVIPCTLLSLDKPRYKDVVLNHALFIRK